MKVGFHTVANAHGYKGKAHKNYFRWYHAMPRSATYQDGSTPSVCIVGAGLAGLCASIQLKRKLDITNFVVFEKAHDVGGAWLANKYPGCQVDYPVWVYSFSFAQNPGWSQLYPDRNEIWAYLQRTAKKYDLYPHIQFNTSVSNILWNEDAKTWTVTTVHVNTQKEQVHEFNIVILGTGPLRQPNYPPIFNSFTGPMMHSAEWNSNVNLENQVVGVVGNGSSAVQVIPSIASKVKKLVVYIREPNYIGPKFQVTYSWITKLFFTIFPFLLWAQRALMFLLGDLAAAYYDSASFFKRTVGVLIKFQIRRNVKDKNLCKLLTPRYSVGYKLPSLAYNEYYKTYNRPNVQLNRSPISRVDGQTIVTEDGNADHLDALILCTGFKVQDFFSPIQVTGIKGVDLMKLWKASRPETFYSVTCYEAPNLFFLLGPNGSSGGGAVFMIECQVTFVINAIRELMKRNASSIQVKLTAQAESMLEITEGGKNKSYMKPVPPGTSVSWLLNENGYPIFWPKSSSTFWLRTRSLNPSKFEFTPRNQNFRDTAAVKYRTIEDV